MLNNYIILDFETANFERTSICQIGMVKVIDNVVTDTIDQLIFPIPNHFTKTNIDCHGITFNDVKYEPKFIDFYPQFMNFIADLPIICHNASFDMGCLNKILLHHNINHEYNFLCSLLLCRRLKCFEDNSLTHIAKYELNYEYKAHDALSDCLATFELIKFMKKEYKVEELIPQYQIGKINKNGYSGFKKK